MLSTTPPLSNETRDPAPNSDLALDAVTQEFVVKVVAITAVIALSLILLVAVPTIYCLHRGGNQRYGHNRYILPVP